MEGELNQPRRVPFPSQQQHRIQRICFRQELLSNLQARPLTAHHSEEVRAQRATVLLSMYSRTSLSASAR